MIPVQTVPGMGGGKGWMKESSRQDEFKDDILDTL
jgi:hypothetical protein